MTVNLYTGNRLTKAQGNENFRVLRGIAPPTVVENDGTSITNTTRGRWKSEITAAPSSFGNYDSVLTAFDGDLAKVQLPVEHRITGAATLGQPASGYLYTPEAYPHYTYLYNSSGHNESTSSSDGRTAAAGYHCRVVNVGQGDCAAFNAIGYVNGAKASATSFLANPAASLFNGSISAGADGVYLNPFEIYLNDAGFDVAGNGIVLNMYRSDITGALGVSWNGIRVQSVGTQKIDSHYFATGAARVGLDLSHATLDMAIALSAGQAIYFNVTPDSSSYDRYPTATNNYIDYNSGSSAMRFVVGGVAGATLTSTTLTLAGTNGLLISGSGCLRLSGSSQFTTGTSTATFTATNKPGASTSVGPTQWMKVVANGNDFFIPMWAA